jgi:hypothetical protein
VSGKVNIADTPATHWGTHTWGRDAPPTPPNPSPKTRSTHTAQMHHASSDLTHSRECHRHRQCTRLTSAFPIISVAIVRGSPSNVPFKTCMDTIARVPDIACPLNHVATSARQRRGRAPVQSYSPTMQLIAVRYRRPCRKSHPTHHVWPGNVNMVALHAQYMQQASTLAASATPGTPSRAGLSLGRRPAWEPATTANWTTVVTRTCTQYWLLDRAGYMARDSH